MSTKTQIKTAIENKLNSLTTLNGVFDYYTGKPTGYPFAVITNDSGSSEIGSSVGSRSGLNIETDIFTIKVYQEKEQGFLTNINEGVKIQSLVIEEGIAKVDFDEQLEYQVGGSCRVEAIRAEITETLKQFETVSDVIISINGRTEDILQP